MKIRVYNNDTDQKSVIRLLETSFSIDSPHNDPQTSINKKIKQNDNLFFVAETEDKQIAGMVMAGYDGHRGWIYSLAVDQQYRKQGTGVRLLQFAEHKLEALGCPKVNLQVLTSNSEVVDFYKKQGYTVEERISMGKRLY